MGSQTLQPETAEPRDIIITTDPNMIQSVEVSIAPVVTQLMVPEDWFRPELRTQPS
jgi:hypothetical protein